MIKIEGIGKTFQSGARATTALAPVNLRIDDGEFVSFIGPRVAASQPCST